MKKLSINIPTYNRDSFLKKNLNIIIDQLRKDGFVDVVEINVSDNASTDNTQKVVTEIIDINKDICITYKCNEKNLGPDLNFVAAMQMAQGEYSILFGDDDFFEEGGIKSIIHLICDNPEITIFLSNRINIDAFDNYLGTLKFMREDIGTEIFDFAKKNDARAYFSLISDHGGLLTFISSVIYKTAILDEIGDYNKDCTGTCYSFLYYWWSSILMGKKLMYVNEYLIRATVSGVTNNNYDQGINRLLVDTEGLSKIASLVFINNKSLENDFLAAVRRPISISRIYSAFMNDDVGGTDKLYSSMQVCRWPLADINGWKYMLNKRNSFKSFIKNFSPHFISRKIRF